MPFTSGSHSSTGLGLWLRIFPVSMPGSGGRSRAHPGSALDGAARPLPGNASQKLQLETEHKLHALTTGSPPWRCFHGHFASSAFTPRRKSQHLLAASLPLGSWARGQLFGTQVFEITEISDAA